MATELPVRLGWKRHLVATQTSRGQVYVLVSVRKTTCDQCRYGVRFETVWGADGGEAQQVSWCSTCFNAECDGVDLDPDHEHARLLRIERLATRSDQPLWSGARPAIEDLERRGLV